MFRKKIEEDGLEKIYKEIELPLEPLLYEIEMAGMKVDGDALKGFSDFISTELEGLSEKIFAISGKEFNINSPKQVGEILQELNIETGKKTATGQISTSKDVLQELAETYEIAQLVIDYRELDKLKATYADALPQMIDSDGRIHGNLESDGRRYGTTQFDRTESAKYSDPHRTRSANPPRIYSRKGKQTDLRRLFAIGTAAFGFCNARSGDARSVSKRRRHSHENCRTRL